MTDLLWGRYSELRPGELAAIRERAPVAYLPWGGLSWHGPHLPLGLDTIVAEAVAERAARRTGGVLLPATAWHLAAAPHDDSLGLPASTLRAILDDSFAALARGGWQVAVVVSGHYTPGGDMLLIAAAREAIARHGLLALAVPPLGLVDDEMLDHGALWESSVLLALRPDLADLAALGGGPLSAGDSGVVGRDPRDTASASLGLSALNLAVERLVIAVRELLVHRDPAPLHALYAQRTERHQAFVARYGADPEAATLAWWTDLTRDE
jgi:creatinine amidohydrolase